MIRCSRQGKSEVVYHEKGILNPNKFITFRVNVDGDTIQVFKGANEKSFMKFIDNPLFKIHYLGISTGWGSKGHWKLINFNIPATGKSIFRSLHVREIKRPL